MNKKVTLTPIGCGHRKQYVVSVPERMKEHEIPDTVVFDVRWGEYQYLVPRVSFSSRQFTADELEAMARQLRALNKVRR